MSLLLVRGDARALPFADRCVQTAVSSPPYWNLRDYGTATWEGGDPECDHVEVAIGMSEKNTLGPSGHLPDKNAANVGRKRQFRDLCGKCGAIRIDKQLGLEPTPDAYVANMVQVFREVRRVLRDDGTLWLNLGDSYAGSGPSGASYQSATTQARAGKTTDGNFRISKTLGERGLTYRDKKPVPPIGLKSKDLVGIPWRVAFALQADGWYLRSDIIWSKPNPMPESVTDRPTKAHEYVFLLAKSERYYFDADAVREAFTDTTIERSKYRWQPSTPPEAYGLKKHSGNMNGRTTQADVQNPLGRNIRSVWPIATQPYTGAHFATMPEKLVERCVLAGSKAGDVVLDPFMGSGTVARVALRLGRKAIGTELNPEYIKLAQDRTRVTLGLPLDGEVA